MFAFFETTEFAAFDSISVKSYFTVFTGARSRITAKRQNIDYIRRLAEEKCLTGRRMEKA